MALIRPVVTAIMYSAMYAVIDGRPGASAPDGAPGTGRSWWRSRDSRSTCRTRTPLCCGASSRPPRPLGSPRMLKVWPGDLADGGASFSTLLAADSPDVVVPATAVLTGAQGGGHSPRAAVLPGPHQAVQPTSSGI
jgi:hypothetical protein